MTPILCCGFECGINSFSLHWLLGGTTLPTFSTTTVRTGARSLNLAPSGTTCTARISIGASVTRFVGRFYIYFATLPTNVQLFSVDIGSGPNIILNATNNFAARVGTSVGTPITSIPVVTDQWYRIDFDFNINTTGNDTCDIKVNGVAGGQAVGAGLSSAQGVLQFGVATALTYSCFIDDFVLSNTEADYPIGAGYGAAFVPTADGTHNVAGAADFKRGAAGIDITNSTADAYLLVGKVPLPASVVADDFINAIAPPNATDYVECVFGPAAPLAAPTIAPQAVDVMVAHHQAATQIGNIRLALNDNGTTDDVLNNTGAGDTALRYARKHYAVPPSAALAWVISPGDGNFNNLRMRFYSSDANPDQYWDAAMIEADFASEVLLPNQLIGAGSTVTINDDLRASPPSSYQFQDNIPNETASTIVTTVLSSSTAEGETPQQQAVIESQGGGEVGNCSIAPGQFVRAVTSVTVAGTNVELSKIVS